MIRATEARTTKAVDILLIQDNSGDSVLVQRAFELRPNSNIIHRVETGKQALSFLRQEIPYESAPRPDLILFDFDSTKQFGLQVLTVMKTDPNTLMIPVIILVNPLDTQMIPESYKLRVNCVIAKPESVRQFLQMIKSVDYFWTQIVSLPKKSRPNDRPIKLAVAS